ncbi:MAG: riboflavin synthase subunit alpha [Candidatus Parcubacteria bacterium]|jgi:riboflavin synthase
MFSGIVKQTSPVVSIDHREGLSMIRVALGSYAEGLNRGASVSIAGVCLTATDIKDGDVCFDMMQETLQKTTLGSLRVGDAVNTERSIRASDEIGGHRVSGHITGMAEIIRIDTPPNNRILTLRVDPAWIPFILPKGFIALDGCSLTVVDVGADTFTVHLIPETLALTTFGRKTVGDHVNLEIDPTTQAIVETVRRYMENENGRAPVAPRPS